MWQGFVTESKKYMNHPDYWKEWMDKRFMHPSDPDFQYGWTVADKRTAKLKFWLGFPKAWLKFQWFTLKDIIRKRKYDACDWQRELER